ncbi:MAG: hypothetical protein ABJI69_02660 [Balneola sp.]
MENFEFINDLAKSSSRKHQIRKYLIFFSIFISVGLYRYVIDYLSKEEDFFNIVSEYIPIGGTSFSFYSNSNVKDENSIYRYFATSVNENSKSINVEIKGNAGNAIQNAYGVINTPKSFGIIQSDTYLNVNILNGINDIDVITPLYMEKLHIFVKVNSGLPENLKVISKNDSTSINFIKKAILSGNFYAGSFNSSARLLLPRLLDIWGLEYPQEISSLNDISISEMFRELEKEDDISEPKVAMVFMGTNNYLIQNYENFLEKNNIRLLGISANDILDLNSKLDQRLQITKFGDQYGNVSNTTTAGVLALLVGSNDLTNSEKHSFLKIIAEVYKDKEIQKISKNPSIQITEAKTYLDEKVHNDFMVFLRSLLIFMVTVFSSTFMLSNLLIQVRSLSQQSKYYTNIYRIYNIVIRENSATGSEEISPHKQEIQKAEYIAKGMENLTKLGKIIREDYSTGGITNKHHDYLLNNLNNVLDWFEQKLVNRISSSIEKLKSGSDYVNDLKISLLKWHSESFLNIGSYQMLIKKLNSKL